MAAMIVWLSVRGTSLPNVQLMLGIIGGQNRRALSWREQLNG